MVGKRSDPGFRVLAGWTPSRMLLYSRSMELELKSGVLLNDALFQAEKLFSGNQQKKLKRVRKEIASGVSISEAFNNSSGFPDSALKHLSLVQSVEDLRTGFERNVRFFEEPLAHNISKLNAMLEPLLMIFLAILVLTFCSPFIFPSFNWENGCEMRGTLQIRQSAGPIPSMAVQRDDEPGIQADAPNRLPEDAGSVSRSFPRCHIA